jgi:hypothetical protein
MNNGKKSDSKNEKPLMKKEGVTEKKVSFKSTLGTAKNDIRKPLANKCKYIN